MADGRPTLHILAGPNGAGKTTLYETCVRQFTAGATFVNPDLLAQQAFGAPATTAAQSAEGQRLADEMRQHLMAERRSLVTESTFSHPSKLDLVRQAKAAGYRVVVYHVSLDDADLAVARVEARVAEGGHPVPEQKIRERFHRNQGLIRDAARLADYALVFDNSRLDQPHERILTLKDGRLADRRRNLPGWAANLYAEVLAQN